MDVPIIKIGNSQGIRLPKNLLERYQLAGLVSLELKDDCIVLKPAAEVRHGWSTAFQKMAANNDDELVIDDVFADEEEQLDELFGEDIITI